MIIVRKKEKGKHFQTYPTSILQGPAARTFFSKVLHQSVLCISFFQDVVSLFVLFASLVSLHVYYSSVAFAFSQSFFDLLPCNVLQKDDLMFHHLTC